MFQLNGKIHDRYTLELKMGFGAETDGEMALDAWFFFPDALYLNADTYPKASVYRDVRTMVRLMTPVFTLQQIADPTELPLQRLTKWCRLVAESQTERHCRMYEHQVKMFCNVVKSAVRDARMPVPELCNSLQSLFDAYRALPAQTGLNTAPEEQQRIFRLGDEYISRVAVTRVFELSSPTRSLKSPSPSGERLGVRQGAGNEVAGDDVSFLSQELEYERRQGYILPQRGDDARNRSFLHRAGQLKKYVESELYILVHERSNTFLLQQLFFMLVAGLSMIFATVISFSFQQSFGNFTVELFLALTISYMFKDRIKSLGQQWFATRAGNRFYDYKTRLALRGQRIGWRKSGTSFVSHDKIPDEVQSLRGSVNTLGAGTMGVTESVLIYRQRLALFPRRLSALSHYPLAGVNEIFRINLREFLRRMDSSHATVYCLDDDARCGTMQAEKVYYVHLVIRARLANDTKYMHFRLALTRRGAFELTELKSDSPRACPK